jgi:hypothetical protein
VLRRQRDVFADVWFERLGSLAVAHLSNLRGSDGYRQQRAVLTKTPGGHPDSHARVSVARSLQDLADPPVLALIELGHTELQLLRAIYNLVHLHHGAQLRFA